MEKYSIKIATYPFSCPICGSAVKKGENYVDNEGAMFCMCVVGEKPPVVPPGGGQVSARKLTPLTLERMKWDNLMMRLELETIAENPEGEVAKKIIARYRRRMKAREERYLSKQN